MAVLYPPRIGGQKSALLVVLTHALDFIARTQNHANALMQFGRLNVQNALCAVNRHATGLLDQVRMAMARHNVPGANLRYEYFDFR